VTRPVRVLQVVSSLGVGGAETWLMEVLRLWTREGPGEMDFLLTSGERDCFDAEAAAMGSMDKSRYKRAEAVTALAALPMDMDRTFRDLVSLYA
jgi:hypothetical protein